MKLFFRIIFSALILGLIIFTYNILSLSYQEIKSIVTPEKLYQTVFGYSEGSRFSLQRYYCLRYGTIVVNSLLVAILSYFFININSFTERIFGLFSLIKKKLKGLCFSFVRLSLMEKVMVFIFFIIIILFRVFLITYLEGDNDELNSYKYFVSQGFWITITYYPDTNNHIFYNLICLLFDKVLNEPLLVMRVPALLANLLFLILLFSVALRKFGFKVAIIFLTLSAFIQEAANFGIIGRGHLWMCLFAFISLFSFIAYVYQSRSPFLLWIGVLFSILALYTVPTYLFFLVSLCIYALLYVFIRRDYTLTLPFIYSGIIIVLGTLLCYLPVILVNGIEVLIENKWVEPKSLDYFLNLYPVYLKELPEYLLGLHGAFRRSYFLAAVLLAVFIVVYSWLENEKEKRIWLRLLLVFYLVPILMIFYLRFFPPYRVFTYYIFMLNMGIGILINSFSERFNVQNKVFNYLVLLLFTMMLWVGIDSFLV